MQLLIIDVQNTYRSHCQELIASLPKFSESFSEILYLFDNISGEEFYEQVPDEWMDDEPFYDKLKSFSKQYAFFRGLMDEGVEGQEIVRLAKFLMKHNLTDARDIAEDKDVFNIFESEFKNSPILTFNFEDYAFYLPDDLITELKDRVVSGVSLVGGGRTECLEEVALLLTALDISFTIREEYTY